MKQGRINKIENSSKKMFTDGFLKQQNKKDKAPPNIKNVHR